MDNDFKFGHSGTKATPEWIKSIDRPTGPELTMGNIRRLSAHAAETDEIVAKIDSMLADLELRLDALEKRYAPPPVVVTPAPQGRWQ
jgi:hypothetical protein